MAYSTKYDQVRKEYEAEKAAERKIHQKSFLESLLVMAILFAIILLIRIPPMNPPMADASGGMDIVLGNDLTGMNNTFEGVAAGTPQPETKATKATPTAPPTQSAPPAPAISQPVPEATNSSDPEDVAVKHEKPKKTPSIIPPVDKPITKPVITTADNSNKPTKQTQTAPPERKVDQNTLFKSGPKGNGGTGGTGASKGTGNTPGGQGDPHGNPNSHSWQKYGSGTEGTGPGYNLAGRGKLNIPRVDASTQVEGRIIVQIVVDRSGNVIEAHGGFRGSTVTDPGLVAKAEEAARKAKFTADENATERQIGTIIYIFKLQ